MAILRLVLAAEMPGSAALLSIPMSIGTSIEAFGSASAADCFTCCCPLPLAVDDADFISSRFLGLGSSSIGVCLNSCDAGAAACGDDAAGVLLKSDPEAFFSSHYNDLSGLERVCCL